MVRPLMINVLSASHARDCLIKGSLAVAVEDLADFVRELPKGTSFIVYGEGYGSPEALKAWKLLHDLGFMVRLYDGGIAEWYQAGLPTEGTCLLGYLREPVKRSAPPRGVHIIALEELRTLLEV